MTAKTTIQTLDKLIDQIKTSSGTERTTLCMTIDSILDKLDHWSTNSQDAKDHHPVPLAASMFITEMKAPLYSLAGLNNFYSDEMQCILWLEAGLRKMSRQTCFDL